MKLRALATTAALAAAGSALAPAPALAGSGGASVARSAPVLVYDAQFLPGADARAHSVSTPSGKTIVTLEVRGLVPGKTYGAHAHTGACVAGDKGAAAGPHWQNAGPAVTPANEIWLDVTPGADGTGRSKAVQEFAFSGDHRPRSVIIHEKATNPADGKAGARIACLTVGF